MAHLLKFFEMHSHRQVVLRTIWSSFLLAAAATVIATLLWQILLPQFIDQFPSEVKIVTFLIAMIIALPVLYAVFYMSLKLSLKNDELFALANLDPLTSIYNRRALMERFEFLARKARRTNEMGALLVIDVDNFKAINDKFGHDVGDQVLIHLGDVLREVCGSESCFARLGGEEFAAARFGMSDQSAMDFAEGIRVGIQNSPLQTTNQIIPFTVSVGYCLVNTGDTLNSVMRNADTALYTAKRTGRNRTVQYTENMVTLAPEDTDLLQVVEKTEFNQAVSSN